MENIANPTIKTSDLRLAEVRYYEPEVHATEIPRDKAYVVLLKKDGKYHNLLQPGEELPVYDRVRQYPNYLEGVGSFGTKLTLASGEEKEGPCFVIDVNPFTDFISGEFVTLEQVTDFVLKSELFFVDRVNIIKNESAVTKFIHSKQVKEDRENLDRLNAFFAEKGKGIQYRK